MKLRIWYFRCPIDPSIFPGFTPDGNALQSMYEAFRFTESYGVIFQCNVKYCLGPCEPVSKFFIFETKTIIALIKKDINVPFSGCL